MRIQKQDDGWWIVDVPSHEGTDVSYASCGPYATKAQALEDKRGLERFLREHPLAPADEAPRSCVAAPPPVAAHPARRNLRESLPSEPGPGSGRRRIKSAPGQKLLPGFEGDC